MYMAGWHTTTKEGRRVYIELQSLVRPSGWGSYHVSAEEGSRLAAAPLAHRVFHVGIDLDLSTRGVTSVSEPLPAVTISRKLLMPKLSLIILTLLPDI